MKSERNSTDTFLLWGLRSRSFSRLHIFIIPTSRQCPPHSIAWMMNKPQTVPLTTQKKRHLLSCNVQKFGDICDFINRPCYFQRYHFKSETIPELGLTLKARAGINQLSPTWMPILPFQKKNSPPSVYTNTAKEEKKGWKTDDRWSLGSLSDTCPHTLKSDSSLFSR